VPRDGDCFQTCVERHLKRHNFSKYADLNIRTYLSNNFSRNFAATLAFVRGNEKVGLRLMNWFLERKIRDATIGTSSKSIEQKSVIIHNQMGNGELDTYHDVDSFFDLYGLTLEDVICLLDDYTKTSSKIAKAKGTTNYINFDIMAENLWFSDVHLDFLIFFGIVDFGCVLVWDENKKVFRLTTMSRKVDSNLMLCSEKSLFLICDKNHYDLLDLHINQNDLNDLYRKYDPNEGSIIAPLSLSISHVQTDKHLKSLCFSKFEHVVRPFFNYKLLNLFYLLSFVCIAFFVVYCMFFKCRYRSSISIVTTHLNQMMKCVFAKVCFFNIYSQYLKQSIPIEFILKFLIDLDQMKVL